jgi:hypothetical protein
MKITVNDFIKMIREDENATNISDLIAVKRYISSTEKIRVAKEVIDLSVEYDRGFIKFDSYKKHLAFIFGVIEAHTDLRFADNWDDKMQEYDALYENELLDAIIDTFRRDYEASLMVLDMMCDDMLADNSIEASVAKLAQGVSENLDVFVGALSDKIEDLDIEKIIPKDLDLNKLQGLLNKFK